MKHSFADGIFEDGKHEQADPARCRTNEGLMILLKDGTTKAFQV